jgi:subtilisin family serine protease
LATIRTSTIAAVAAVVTGVAASVPVAMVVGHPPLAPLPPVAIAPIDNADGTNHFVVTLAGRAGPPSATMTAADPVLLAPGEPTSLYTQRLDAIELQSTVGSVYTDGAGDVRVHVLSSSPVVHESDLAAYRQSMNAAADPRVVDALARTKGIRTVSWITPGTVSIHTTLSSAQVADLPGVVSVAPDGASAGLAVDDPLFATQWALENAGQRIRGVGGTPGDDIGATGAWALSTGAGVTVAVIDTGSQPDHPDLAGAASPFGWDFAHNDAATGVIGTSPGAGHGTAVTGVIAARTDNALGVAGMAPAARVLEVKASDTGVFDDATVVRGIYYSLGHGARIINLSLGSTSYDPTLEAAIQQAQADGVLVVVAAGNDGRNIDLSGADPLHNTNADAVFPAALPEPNVIAVGASDAADSPASFSNTGAHAVSLFAPGVDIMSTAPGSTYRLASGSSMSAALVSAAAALVWARDPALTYDQVKAVLLRSVTRAPALASSCSSGGVLDAAAALAAVPAVAAGAPAPADTSTPVPGDVLSPPPAPPAPVALGGAAPPPPGPSLPAAAHSSVARGATTHPTAAHPGRSGHAAYRPVPAPGAPASTSSTASGPAAGGSSAPSWRGATGPAFGLTSVSPASGGTGGGVVLTVYGRGIPAGSSVLVGGASTTVVSDDAPGSIVVSVGPHITGPAAVEVIGPDGTVEALPGAFTFVGG